MDARVLLNNNSILKRIGFHVLFWMCVYAYNLLEGWSSAENKTALVELYTTRLPLQMLIAYVVAYFLLPKYLVRKKYLEFLFSLLLCVYITCILYVTYRAFYFELAYPGYFRTATPQALRAYFDLAKFFMYATSFFTPAAVMAIIKLVRTQHEEQQKRQELEKEKLHTELSFLKNQLNPHFLFNTLNNLYMLTLKASPQAPEVVARLSDTLDYMLYRCHEKVVPFKGEIQLIENYVLLEKLRLSRDVSVNFSYNEMVNSKTIAPLILLSLVENAFKHGLANGIGKSKIDIQLTFENELMKFSVFNTKSGSKAAPDNQGIGLRNIRRQLQLIYPKNHELVIEDTEETYLATLQINLSSSMISA